MGHMVNIVEHFAHTLHAAQRHGGIAIAPPLQSYDKHYSTNGRWYLLAAACAPGPDVFYCYGKCIEKSLFKSILHDKRNRLFLLSCRILAIVTLSSSTLRI